VIVKNYANTLTYFVPQFVFARNVIVKNVKYFVYLFVKKKKIEREKKEVWKIR
jgi:hypothetical protein